jgi:F-type H+-transporting ATPase subunit a
VATEEGKIDPMHQFTVEPLVPLQVGGYDVSFTNSAAWMLAALVIIGLFMWGGMKRQVVPGRWQMAVEGLTGFIDDMVNVNIGPQGKKYTPYIFSLFTFILVCEPAGPDAVRDHSWRPPVHRDEPFQRHRRARGHELLDRPDRRLLEAHG